MRNLLFEAVLKGNCTVEYKMLGRGVLAVNAEVAHTQELELCRCNGILKQLFDLAVIQNYK